MAAAAVGRILDVPWEGIQRALAEFQAVSQRGDVARKNGIAVIDDCYNASPGAMSAALDLLVDVSGVRKIAVLGDMLELGAESGSLHAAVGEKGRARVPMSSWLLAARARA